MFINVDLVRTKLDVLLFNLPIYESGAGDKSEVAMWHVCMDLLACSVLIVLVYVNIYSL